MNSPVTEGFDNTPQLDLARDIGVHLLAINGLSDAARRWMLADVGVCVH